MQGDAGAKFWKAQALATLGRFGEALPLYQEIGKDNNAPRQKEAILAAADMLRAQGRTEEALQYLTGLSQDKEWRNPAQLRAAEIYLDRSDPAAARRAIDAARPTTPADRKTKRFLEARMELAEQRPERALQILEPTLKRLHGARPVLALSTLFMVADLHLRLNTPETADDFIEDFIEHHPYDTGLPRLFAKLDELYRAERKPARNQLEHWTREPEQPRRALAQWYLARLDIRAGRRERAYRYFSELRSSHLKNPVVAPALLEYAQTALEDGQVHEALAILADARALAPEQPVADRIELMAAQAHYQANELQAAAEGFEKVGFSNSSLSGTSLFNAAIGRLQQDDKVRFTADYAQLQKSGANEETRAELRLEQSLAEAAKGDARAAQSLREFVREFPTDDRVSEALVALAEVAFHRNPPAIEEARKYLAQARESHPTAIANERADYLSIWLEDTRQGNDDTVISSASRFLQDHPDSVLAPEVRMKLAETYFRRQDFSNAQTQFELLAQKDATGPLAEKALFFAGESAMSSMGQNSLERAVVLFNEVVQLKGDLRWAARNEQAAIERKLGKPQDALSLYDEVLKSDARPAEKREALCGKGDIYFELGSTDPKNYQLAMRAYDELANDVHEPGHWRNQALFKKALCLEKIADRGGALSLFYDILDSQSQSDRPPELFWFYKAGFDAARLLEEEQKWTSAATIYEKLVAVAGPRADEARARLNRLRLEHFLWEQ